MIGPRVRASAALLFVFGAGVLLGAGFERHRTLRVPAQLGPCLVATDQGNLGDAQAALEKICDGSMTHIVKCEIRDSCDVTGRYPC